MVSQVFIRWKSYVLIRPESLDAKASELDFVCENTHIINIITSLRVDQPQRKIYGGLSSTRKGNEIRG
jgi:hypothetical protein